MPYTYVTDAARVPMVGTTDRTILKENVRVVR